MSIQQVFFYGVVDFDPGTGVFNLTSSGTGDAFILKLDTYGNFIWAKRIGGSQFDDGIDITVDNSENIYITGFFEGICDFDPGPGIFDLTDNGNGDAFVLKLNESGDLVWVKSLGGAYGDGGSSVSIDANGNVYTIGSFAGTVDFDPGTAIFNMTSVSQETFILKLNSAGDFIWAKNPIGLEINSGSYITVDQSENVYITGSFNGTADFDLDTGVYNLTSNGNADIFISKLNSFGNLLWAKSIGGTVDEVGYSIKIDTAGDIYIGGYFFNTVDFDPNSGIYNMTSAGSKDIFILKLDTSGNFIWSKAIGGASPDYIESIELDASGYIYLTGQFTGTSDFDPGTSNFNLTPVGGGDAFVLKLSTSGNFEWAFALGQSGNDGGNSITTDSNGNIYTIGAFHGTIDFNPNIGTFNLSSTGTSVDIYILKMSQTPIGIEENYSQKDVSIYPNPSTGSFNISTISKNSILEVYNSLGTLIQKQTTTNEQSTIDLSNEASGLYFIKVIS